MKLLIACLLSLSSIAYADATRVTVYNKPYDARIPFSEYLSRFEANPALGRARLSLAFEDNGSEYPSVVRENVLVEGLTYNSSRGEVVYTNQRTGTQSVCGMAKKPESGKDVRSSRLCTLEPTQYIYEYDDGYEIKKFLYLRIEMVVQ